MLFSSVAIKTQPGNCIDDKYLRQQLALPEVEIFLVPWEAVWEVFEEVERKLRPAQAETTAAFRSIPKTNSSPQQPPGGNELGGSGPRCAEAAGAPSQGRLSSSSSHLAWYFSSVPCCSNTEAVYMLQKTSSENRFQTDGTHQPILSTGLADLLIICLGFYHCQENAYFKSKDSLLS